MKDRLLELIIIRDSIKALAKKIANEDNFRVARPYLDELMELSEKERELNEHLKGYFTADIERRKKLEES